MEKYIMLTVVVALGIILAGCSTNEEANTQDTVDDTVQTEGTTQEGDIQIIGEVMEIAGNEVTLALGDISAPNFQQRFSDRENMPDGEGFPQRENREGYAQRENGEGFPQRGNGEGYSQRENGEGNAQRENRENFFQTGEGGMNRGFLTFIEKTGETASYTIPEGMVVTGRNGETNDYSAISAEMILRLTVNSDGSVVAVEIL